MVWKNLHIIDLIVGEAREVKAQEGLAGRRKSLQAVNQTS